MNVVLFIIQFVDITFCLNVKTMIMFGFHVHYNDYVKNVNKCINKISNKFKILKRTSEARTFKYVILKKQFYKTNEKSNQK